ncbi:hypothetical protein Slin14017_G112760 [Septoria linicola]|nr:hypothetical protein Slin14017_G112700 [Septoria linicola]KAI5358990.1 hypothetical protein Slin14017_G112730 [Septoria linicola]KAI5358993.1 hypothetical protein Slin14017_G112760 [Septoria linicola]
MASIGAHLRALQTPVGVGFLLGKIRRLRSLNSPPLIVKLARLLQYTYDRL